MLIPRYTILLRISLFMVEIFFIRKIRLSYISMDLVWSFHWRKIMLSDLTAPLAFQAMWGEIGSSSSLLLSIGALPTTTTKQVLLCSLRQSFLCHTGIDWYSIYNERERSDSSSWSPKKNPTKIDFFIFFVRVKKEEDVRMDIWIQ